MELKPGVDRAQAAYAASLAWGTRIGLGLLIALFLAYLADLIPAHVPIDQLPRHWGKPASDLLAATGTSAGWGWAAALPRADMLVLAAIGFLAACSIACLLLAMRAFLAGSERVPAALCALEVLVILLAASGLLAGGH
jgi:hypothetical protein